MQNIQNNIVHKLPKVPNANEMMAEPEVFSCVICRCFQHSFGVKDSELASNFFGRYLYVVNMQVPDYPYMNIATVCQECHWKIANRSEHDCLGCERGSCKKIMEHLQGRDWTVCVNPQCSYCFMIM
jgi:hypothetical protein